MLQNELYSKLNNDTSLTDIQTYIREVIKARGFIKQTVQENMLLLIEETGELAKAIRKNSKGMSVDEERLYKYDTIESEVADIFIVLLSLCNNLDLNLFNVFMRKEKINIERTWKVNQDED